MLTGKERLEWCCHTALGCITDKQLPDIANDPEIADVMLIIRGLKGRILSPARMVAHYVELIEADPEDRVRDVSVTTEFYAKWKREHPQPRF